MKVKKDTKMTALDMIMFAEWIAENHYRLYNINENGVRIWKHSEGETYSTLDLLLIYIDEQK